MKPEPPASATPMPGSLLDRLRPERIVVLRTGRLGDLLLAFPALQALRRAVPGAAITVLVDALTLPLARRLRAVDEVVVVPPMPGLNWEDVPPASADEVSAFFQAMRARRFDLALQLKGAGDATNPFVKRLGATVTAGQRGPSAEPLDLDMPYGRGQPEILRLLDVMHLIGVPAGAWRLELPVEPGDWADLEMIPELDHERLITRRYIGVNIGARSGARRWPLQRFQQVIETLHTETGCGVLLLGAPSDRERAGQLMWRLGSPPPVLNLAGRTSIGGLIALVSRLRLLLTNDSFPGHLAAALGTPAVIVFGNADPVRWGPLSRTWQRPVADLNAPCRYLGTACGCADTSDALCLAGVSVESVLHEARSLLALLERQEEDSHPFSMEVEPAAFETAGEG